MDFRVVVNASPLIFLAKSGLLEILRILFAKVYTAEEIMKEGERPFKPGLKAPEVLTTKEAKWIRGSNVVSKRI